MSKVKQGPSKCVPSQKGLGKALGTSIREFKEEVKSPEAAAAKEGEQNDREATK